VCPYTAVPPHVLGLIIGQGLGKVRQGAWLGGTAQASPEHISISLWVQSSAPHVQPRQATCCVAKEGAAEAEAGKWEAGTSVSYQQHEICHVCAWWSHYI